MINLIKAWYRGELCPHCRSWKQTQYSYAKMYCLTCKQEWEMRNAITGEGTNPASEGKKTVYEEYLQ